MNVTVRIPDELAARLSAEGDDLERLTLEALGSSVRSAAAVRSADSIQGNSSARDSDSVAHCVLDALATFPDIRG